MAINFKFGINKTINISIKDHALRFVELKQTQPLVIQRMGEYYLPSGLIKEGKILDVETLSTILEQCVSEWKISKRMIRFLVPDPFVVIRKVSIPKEIKEDEINGYLYMEIGTSIHLPFEDPVFDFFLQENNDKETNEILLFAAPEDVVREYMDLFERVKLKPIAADLSSLALNRYYYQLDPAKSNDNHLLVQIDLQTVNVCIFENHLPVFMRQLNMDSKREKWIHSTSKDSFLSFQYSGDRQDILTSLESIYNEIDKVMNFYRYSLNQGKKQVQTMILDGDHPWLDEIFEQMGNRFDVPMMKLNDMNTSAGPIPAQFHLNVGLGLKEV
ncbi:pilus assembly protein PilM [Neobacillus sp. OS1-2]|uniref:type IV pilus biogenesis protein PilM n=1 Tax=Neobacillus sp. OS1-2 TaxID=3070680 RepID=UPI0027E0C045|nr:pilus assembly protein PilM [Neobacillus sp. OS1-2]WML40717.1 pilus assembly protein PilM [Neobacillus sp. OS1-2]